MAPDSLFDEFMGYDFTMGLNVELL